jgi:hypothetical protein
MHTAMKMITPTFTTWLTRHGPRNDPHRMKTLLIKIEIDLNGNVKIVLYVILKMVKKFNVILICDKVSSFFTYHFYFQFVSLDL